ncbi:MAG: Bug family tripartite tricarboxylate transporter substrate binding protein [Pseudorhodoplanes sp.]|uniref:Bug family tripartite tricarboxylate transporter substrate binding protein n=1 Tax=Pseudorhodoplanes sp. TaxID=1934341 RepID=UPI003D0CF517
MSLQSLKTAMLLAVFAVMFGAPQASAQGSDWPKARPITWLIGFAPGGAADTITRAVADRVSKKIGQTIVIENRTGGVGTIALNAVTSAQPDGYTLITIPGPILYGRPTPAVGPDLESVALLGTGPMLLAGPASADIPDLKAFIARAKAEPSKFNFGSSGNGSSQHIAGELFNDKAGTKIAHVPYRGGAQVTKDVLGGVIQLAVSGVGPLAPHIKAGKLRGYAVTTTTRFPTIPDVPTLAELGFDGVDLSQWFGVATVKGTPPAIVGRLNEEINAALAAPEIQQLMLSQGLTATALPADAFARAYAADNALYKSLADKFGIKVE